MTENTTDQRLQTVAEGIANIVGAPYEDWRHYTGEANAILSRLDKSPTPAADEVEARAMAEDNGYVWDKLGDEGQNWWRKRAAAEPAGDEPVCISDIIQDVAELPDRDSPEDWPAAMLVTGEELRIILERYLPATPTNPERLVEQKAAEAIRKAFFTSVSGGSPQYHLSLAYQSIDEMHEAEDAIKAWAKSVLEPKA